MEEDTLFGLSLTAGRDGGLHRSEPAIQATVYPSCRLGATVTRSHVLPWPGCPSRKCAATPHWPGHHLTLWLRTPAQLSKKSQLPQSPPEGPSSTHSRICPVPADAATRPPRWRGCAWPASRSLDVSAAGERGPWSEPRGSGEKTWLRGSSLAPAAAWPGIPAVPACGPAGGPTASGSPASGPASAFGAFRSPSESRRVCFLGRLSPRGHSCDRTAARGQPAAWGPGFPAVSAAGPAQWDRQHSGAALRWRCPSSSPGRTLPAPPQG